MGLADELAFVKSKVLSQYCLDECDAHNCCNFDDFGRGLGYLHKSELEAIFGLQHNAEISQETTGLPVLHSEDEADLSGLEKECIVVSKQKYVLNVKVCPVYDDGKCLIHAHQNRPSCCEYFPIDFAETCGVFGLYLIKGACPGIQEIDLEHIKQRCKGLELPMISLTLKDRKDKYVRLKRII